MREKITIVMAIAIVFLISCSSGNDRIPAYPLIPDYIVKINKNNIRLVQVEASFPLLYGTLWMSTVGTAPLTDGYATFVHDLKATDEQGNTIPLHSLGKGIWKADAHGHLIIHLKYSVEIGHDKVHWAVSSAFARAYAVGQAIFFTGRTIFIAPKGDGSSKIRVHFTLPEGWEIATPYLGLEKKLDSYEASNLTDLWDNGNLAGQLEKEEIKAGKLQIIIAGSLSMEGSIRLFKSAISKLVNAYTSGMGGTPAGKLVVLSSAAQMEEGGETFGKSISLMFYRPPEMLDAERWVHLLSHEVFHLWNGQAMSPLNQSQVEWFIEGYTDYIADVTALRTGLISKDEFFRQLSICVNVYLHNAGIISMLDAGDDKGTNYNIIYGGGMAIAFAMDLEARKSTDNKKNLMGFMKKMFVTFGVNHKLYTYQDIIKVSSSVAEKDLSGFFSKYVAGLQVLPINTYLQSAGLKIAQQSGENLIKPDPDAGLQEKALLEGILYK
ncbi:MAG TPA: hypothetical protein VKR53_02790 [Puia sp.]|nr:hypothetical protein [Puia sp.]